MSKEQERKETNLRREKKISEEGQEKNEQRFEKRRGQEK